MRMQKRWACVWVLMLAVGCNHQENACNEGDYGGCGCSDGTSGAACPAVEPANMIPTCVADTGFPSSGDCTCTAYACEDLSDGGENGDCFCRNVGDSGPFIASCPSSPMCCDEGDGCYCYYGKTVPATCPNSGKQVASCDATDWPKTRPIEVDQNFVASCNPLDTNVGGGGGGGGGNCKHSGEECSSSSECCGGSICNDDPESSFYHECE